MSAPCAALPARALPACTRQPAMWVRVWVWVRLRVSLLLALLLALLLGACAGGPPPTDSHSTQAAPMAQRSDVVLHALGLLDTAYRHGGRGPATGFDCSGLVSHVFREALGLQVQGSSAELAQKARPVPVQALQPGDLVFFNTLGPRHSHVGVYVGDGRFVHASNPRTGVRLDLLSNRYYAQRFEGAGSLLD